MCPFLRDIKAPKDAIETRASGLLIMVKKMNKCILVTNLFFGQTVQYFLCV